MHEGVAETSVGRGARGMEKREETSRAGGSLWPEFWTGGAFRDPEFQVDLWIPRPGSMVPLKKAGNLPQQRPPRLGAEYGFDNGCISSKCNKNRVNNFYLLWFKVMLSLFSSPTML